MLHAKNLISSSLEFLEEDIFLLFAMATRVLHGIKFFEHF
jgi:hypothetical protein